MSKSTALSRPQRNNCGQSTAVRSAVREARGAVIAMLDGNGQNDPADIAALLPRWHELQQGGLPYPVLITGWRDKRRNTRLRRLSSRIANGVRSSLLGDATPESARDCIGTSVGRIVLARRRGEATITAVRPG